MAPQLALDGGQPVRTQPFPSWPVFDEGEEKALLSVLHSGQWGMLGGGQVKAFEEKFAAYQQARFGVCVPNGTLALEMALRALGLGPGDEVITTGYTFIATASAALLVGAKPVFVDIEWDTFNLNPSKIEAAITGQTKAILPVHLAGRAANMDAIMEIARRHNLRVLEDACQAWGVEWRGRRVGAIGDLGAFSFQSSKNITAGEGGIVVTNDPELHELCWSLHNVGRSPSGAWYHHERLGWNLRMTEWTGAILQVQLERLPEQTKIRTENARYLAEALSEVPGLSPLPHDPNVTQNSYHLFILRYDPAAFGGHSRDDFVEAMRAEGITPCSPGYRPSLIDSPAMQRTMTDMFGPESAPRLSDYPVTKRAVHQAVWLSQTVLLGDHGDMDSIVEAAQKIQRAWGT